MRATLALGLAVTILTSGGTALATDVRPAADSPDPFLWLEEAHGARAMDWVAAQNARTSGILQADPRVAELEGSALAVVQAADRIPTPQFLRGEVYNFWQDSDHVRGVWRRTSLADYANPKPQWTTVLDIDGLARTDGASWVFKGADCEWTVERRCLVSISDGGEDAVTIREFDLAAGVFAPAGFTLPKGKQEAAWLSPNRLLVSREWAVGELTESGYPFVVREVIRGRPLAEAREVFRGARTDVNVAPQVWRDGDGHQAAMIERAVSFFEGQHWLLTARGPQRLAMPLKSHIEGLLAGRLLVTLQEDWAVDGRVFPQGALVSVDLNAARKTPEALAPDLVVAPGPRESVEAVAMSGKSLFVVVNQDVKGRIFIYRPTPAGGWRGTRLALPDNAALNVVDADSHADRAFISVTGFLTPTSLWFSDAASGKLESVKTIAPKFDSSRDAIDQFDAVSSDGTRIPYFLVHPKAMALNGANPTLLYAYGGFQVSELPAYSPVLGKLWLELGGVYALANIRGGGEFGPKWHEAGLKTHRQIIYDDFAAVAKDMIARGVTSPRRLGIQGGSNGGLLVAVAVTQRPALFRVGLSLVPLTDMLRYHHFRIGKLWVPEYGSADDEAGFRTLFAYSPYHRVQDGARYPSMLFTTAESDSRVDPLHARKMAARMQAAQGNADHPILLRVETKAGHGAGKPISKVATDITDEIAFVLHELSRP